MRFGEFLPGETEGALLAHGLTCGRLRLKKGHRLQATDIAAMEEAGVKSVTVLLLEDGDVPEDDAARRLAAAVDGKGLRIGEAGTGRVNIFAAQNGLFRVDRSAIDAFNRIDPAITFACLADRRSVTAGEMVATIKIIPLAVSNASLEAAEAQIAQPDFCAVKAFSLHRVSLVSTQFPILKASVMDKTRAILEERLKPSGSMLVGESRVPHETNAVAAAVSEAAATSDMVIVFGASAVVDPDDVIPAAIRAAGGHVEAVGMPVDPGNLLVLGSLDGKPVIGAPGCARSPKENGFDWVLARILAGEEITRAGISGMGVGGLLMEIPSRPQPRRGAGKKADRPNVAAIVLAAGRASRMGESGHKLLAEFDGVPLVRRVVAEACQGEFSSVSVVTGYRSAEIAAALEGLPVTIVENADYAEGMAGSLKRGIQSLSPGTDGALVLLADMPGVTASHMRTLAEAFRKEGSHAVVRGVADGRRGNPVILPRALFEGVMNLVGDVGARAVIETSGLAIADVELGDAALVDVDTPEAVRAAGGIPRG